MKARTRMRPAEHWLEFSWSEDDLIALLKEDARRRGHEVPEGQALLNGLERDYATGCRPGVQLNVCVKP